MTNTARAELAKAALEKTLEVREQHGYDFRSPLCVYELADRAGVKVRFVDDVSMEGVYAALTRPTILLSSLRPMPRRAFTCAHELGHHFFGDGSTIDALLDEGQRVGFQPKEFLADTFAGFLLMPSQGVKRAFASRAIDPTIASPEDIFMVASSFGVGYETLIWHLAGSLRSISTARADLLTRSKLGQIRERLLGFTASEPLVIADRHHAIGTLDAEVGGLILLPTGCVTESDQIELLTETANGPVFRAMRPGLVRVYLPNESWGIIVRVSRFQYSGLARYRHLEEADGD